MQRQNRLEEDFSQEKKENEIEQMMMKKIKELLNEVVQIDQMVEQRCKDEHGEVAERMMEQIGTTPSQQVEQRMKE